MEVDPNELERRYRIAYGCVVAGVYLLLVTAVLIVNHLAGIPDFLPGIAVFSYGCLYLEMLKNMRVTHHPTPPYKPSPPCAETVFFLKLVRNNPCQLRRLPPYTA